MVVTSNLESLPKTPTGIQGLDEITYGGLPAGRPTLLVGGAGSGKTMLAMEFLVRGATEFGEPGVYVSFEETAKDLAANFASRGFDLDKLIAEKKIYIDHVRIERSEIEETGEYDLEGLFIRLGYAVKTVGAKRVVLDTIEALFAGLTNTGILRAELRRLFTWLKERGLTAIITGERGVDTLTRYGLEEYVADCVILLDNRVIEQISTRRIRILKYRGSQHGTNEYPFLIENTGITVLPITSIGLQHEVTTERISTGIERLDNMLGGKGYYRGSSILVTGTAGTGKSSLAASFAASACNRGECSLYFAFEESQSQIIRNMNSIGLDLQHCVDNSMLIFHSSRPTATGLETHLAQMFKLIMDIKPSIVVIDPISNLISVGNLNEVKSMLTRLVDYLKCNHITSMFISLNTGGENIEQTEVGMSSLMDTWIVLRDVERDGERNREMHVLKSRGMKHSNQLREFVMTDQGIELLDVYTGPAGVLTGTARVLQEARDKAESLNQQLEIDKKKRKIEGNRKALQAQIEALNAEIETTNVELDILLTKEKERTAIITEDKVELARLRGADTLENKPDQSEQGGSR
ncbi:MAG: circadian clock protein KaiC [Armatimonadota bacterium]